MKTGFAAGACRHHFLAGVHDAFTPRTMSGMNAMSANAPTIADGNLTDWPTMELGIMKMSSARFTGLVTRSRRETAELLLEAHHRRAAATHALRQVKLIAPSSSCSRKPTTKMGVYGAHIQLRELGRLPPWGGRRHTNNQPGSPYPRSWAGTVQALSAQGTHHHPGDNQQATR